MSTTMSNETILIVFGLMAVAVIMGFNLDVILNRKIKEYLAKRQKDRTFIYKRRLLTEKLTPEVIKQNHLKEIQELIDELMS